MRKTEEGEKERRDHFRAWSKPTKRKTTRPLIHYDRPLMISCMHAAATHRARVIRITMECKASEQQPNADALISPH